MLIRVRGGSAGIKDYLERGRKDGREFSREQLDERVMLSGDLVITDTIINDMQREGERYLHITLAFKEDQIDRDTLQAITDEFREFAMTAYGPDEYNFYAEAHLPKITSYTNKRTGKSVERKPHIHIVVPKVNMFSGTMIDPLYRPVLDKYSGRLVVPESQLQWLEAFQEQINAKYGLASPKDHRRIEFTDESAVIARYKGDIFKGERAELKNRILSDVLDRGITSFDKFADLVAEHGEARLRRAGQEDEYINIKPADAAKGINLKEWMFSREFLTLPTEEKRRRIAAEERREYVESGQSKPTSREIEGRLQHWREIRSRELKYLNAGSRKVYAAYREADPEQRRAILAEREALFYQRHRKDEPHEQEHARGYRGRQSHTKGLTREPPPHARNRLRSLSELDLVRIDGGSEVLLPRDVHRDLVQQGTERDQGLRRDIHRIGRADSVVGQLNRDTQERAAQMAAEREDFAQIKAELDASRLLARLSHTHGVTPEKYQVEKGADGADRIKAGKRRLNVSDFLTKELHLPWKEAALMLREAHAEQRAQEREPQARSTPRQELWESYRKAQPDRTRQKAHEWDAQRQSERNRRAVIRDAYQAERRTIQNDKRRKPAERKAALSIAGMQRVNKDMSLREAVSIERQQLKDKYSQPQQERYRAFLHDLASRGDEAALAELRRQRVTVATPAGLNAIEGVIKVKRKDQAAPIERSLVYSVDRSGNVTYYADAAKQHALVIDSGQRVSVASVKDREAVEVGLRLAVQKFGTGLKINGSDEFKSEIIDAALKTGLRVEFASPDMNAELQRRRDEREELQARGKAFIADERAKGAKGRAAPAPAPDKKPAPKKEQERTKTKTPQRSRKERGIDR